MYRYILWFPRYLLCVCEHVCAWTQSINVPYHICGALLRFVPSSNNSYAKSGRVSNFDNYYELSKRRRAINSSKMNKQMKQAKQSKNILNNKSQEWDRKENSHTEMNLYVSSHAFYRLVSFVLFHSVSSHASCVCVSFSARFINLEIINFLHFSPTYSLHLLSVLLVIHHIDTTNINEPLIDSHTTAINIIANEEQQQQQLMPTSPLPSLPLSLSSTLDSGIAAPNEHNNNAHQINKSTTMVNNDDAFHKSRPSSSSTRNQSIDSPRSAIGSVVSNNINNDSMAHVQTHNRSMSPSPSPPSTVLSSSSSSSHVQPAAITKLMTTSNGGGKVYNKNDLRKRKIKSTAFDQLTTIDDWKCPNISENSRYLECGCDIPYTLRCSGDIHGLQQIAHGLRQSKYPVSLLDCTLKNVTFLSDARIFDNVSLHGLVISSGEIKRVHRHAFLGLKMPLQALGLPNNALMNVPAHSLTSLTSLDRLDLSNNRIKYLGPSDFLVCVSFLLLSQFQAWTNRFKSSPYLRGTMPLFLRCFKIFPI